MTYYSRHYSEYVFAAMTRSDVGGNIRKGDTFTFGGQSATLSVVDNGGSLSTGYRGHSRDSSGQQAQIEDDHGSQGNGRQIYVDKIWVLRGSDGQNYRVAQIEQEGNHDEYYAFIGAQPADGVTMTVLGRGYTCSVRYSDFMAPEPDEPEEPRVIDDPDLVTVDFNDLATGTKVTGQIDGLTISATGGSGDAMIFDSANPTGGDWDLATDTQEKILIISEDGDSSDPDDNIGGVLTIDFDTPSTVYDLVYIDTEEGGTVRAFDADGNLLKTVDLDHLRNGELDQVIIDQEGVSQLVITLNGSGAIDDLRYAPEAPAVGSLSGRYFMDANDNNQDDGEMGIAGIVVTLVETGATTTTGANGSYSFSDLAPGDYTVTFTDPNNVLDGKRLVDANVGPDATDSDAVGNTTLSTISGITVVAGQDTPDNDAGAEDIPLGSIGGEVFCDVDEDSVQSAGDLAIAGVAVALINVATGQVVAEQMTGDDGSYLFEGLEAGSYAVSFPTTEDGKSIVPFDVGDDDTIDSDANPDTGRTSTIVLGEGEDVRDVDAGFVLPNEAPVVVNDVAEVCVDQSVLVDALANDMDPEDDAISITSVGGQPIAEGETVSVDGINVTLQGGALVIDGSGNPDLVALNVGEEAVRSISYHVTDSAGNTSDGSVDVTFKGAAETLAELNESIQGIQVTYQVVNGNNPLGSTDEAFTLKLTNTGDERLEGLVIEEAYNADIDDQSAGNVFSYVAGTAGTNIDDAPEMTGELYIATDEFILQDALTGTGSNWQSGVDNLDLVQWILNQDFAGQGFTDGEIQGAIWKLLDGPRIAPGAPDTDLDDVQAIFDAAVANGEGFTPGQGDVVGVFINPLDTPDDPQPYIIALNYDDLYCFC